MGIVGSENVSSAQSKGAEETVAGIRGSNMGTGDDSARFMVGNGDSVCVDMVAEEGVGMIKGVVWTEMEDVVAGSVWVAMVAEEVGRTVSG